MDLYGEYPHADVDVVVTDDEDNNTLQGGFASRDDDENTIFDEAVVEETAPNRDEMIIEANAVVTATSTVILNADGAGEVGEETREEEEEGEKSRIYWTIAGFLTIAGVIILFTLINKGQGQGQGQDQDQDPMDMVVETSPTYMPSTSPTLAPTTADFDELLSRLKIFYGNDGDDGTTYFEEVFADTQSPQYQAALWIANEDLYPRNSVFNARVLQRYALVTLYFATNGDDWIGCNRLDPICTTQKYGWLTPTIDECDWFAITCIDATITRIFIIKRGAFTITLTGTIPHEISFFTDLEILSLDDHEITGPIPSSLAQLTSLRTFRLCSNQLEGTIPAEMIPKISSLEVLCLGNNRLTGTFPFESFHWETISEIYLHNNNFRGTVPSAIGQAQSLRALDIGKNDFEGTIPIELFDLTNLHTLRYGTNHNLRGGLYSEFSKLTSLEELSLQNTQLLSSGSSSSHTLPNEFFQLSNLIVLELSNITLSGTISELFVNFQQLKNISLDNNALTGSIPTAFDTMLQLERIELQFNQLNGTISQAICERRYPLGSSKIQVLATDCGPMENGDPPLVSCSCCNYCNANPPERFG